MTDPIKEQLSACLDGELTADELDLLVRQAGRNTEARASLGRYALIGEALRAQSVAVAPADFAQRVSAAIQAEASPPARRESVRSTSRWLRPAAGFAVAAGVAAVTVVMLQPATDDSAPYVAEATSTPVAAPAADSYIVPAGTATSGFVPATRLTNYVVAHSEYSSPLGRRSVLSGVLADEADVEGDDTVDAEDPTVVTQPR